MIQTHTLAARRLDVLVSLLDIPDSHYQLATARYESVGRWLQRPLSTLAAHEPAVCPQGSFRYGTVNRPLLRTDEYDLDAIAELLLLTKGDQSQKELKRMLGAELIAYATAHDFKSPPEEKKRCWRLDYADQVKFHMDVLPAIPEDEGFKEALVRAGVDSELAVWSIAITDKQHPGFAAVQRDWPRSNPKGFAKWFERRMRVEAQRRLQAMLQARALASIDDVPTWEWKTPLQRSIQILKRHRDVMFAQDCSLAPISMIITTLAAHAYEGEDDLYAALTGILERMPTFVRASFPRVPNPVNPAEDFADRWKADPWLEDNFWKWHMRASADIACLDTFLRDQELREFAQETLGLSLGDGVAGALASAARGPQAAASAVAPMVIARAPKPWGTLG
jgi:hypothetical protein